MARQVLAAAIRHATRSHYLLVSTHTLLLFMSTYANTRQTYTHTHAYTYVYINVFMPADNWQVLPYCRTATNCSHVQGAMVPFMCTALYPIRMRCIAGRVRERTGMGEGESGRATGSLQSAGICVCVCVSGDQSVFSLRKRRRIKNANHVPNKKIKGKRTGTHG